MKTGTVWMLAAWLALPAGAQELTPAAHLQFDFGGRQQPVEHLRLRLRAESRDWQPPAREQAPPLTVASIELSPDRPAYSTLLGLPLRAATDRSQASGEDSGGHTWLWIGAGVVGAVAIAALAAGGTDQEVNNGSNCTVENNGQCEVPGIPLPPIISGGG